MWKKSISMALVGLGVAASLVLAQTPAPSTAAPADDHATVNQRLENQQDRVQAGKQDGELTKGEATRLKADDAAVKAEEKVDRKAHDGKLTTGEKKQLNRQLNRNSRQIYRARHNQKTPKK